MLPLFYAEINTFCILVAAMILRRVLTGVDKQKKQILFSYALIANALTFVLDLLWYFIDIKFFRVSNDINYLVNGLYFIQSTIGAYSWFFYSEYIQESQFRKNKALQILSVLPVLITVFLVIISYKTGWLFYIDASGTYHRGSLYFLQTTISYGYVIFTAGKALCKAFIKKNYAQKNELISLASFAVYPLLFGTLQVIFPTVPLLCVGITLAILNVYLSFQEQRISLDALTQLNNRNQLTTYLSTKIKQNEKNKSLYLLIIDADEFKKINDTHGHIEGDSALIYIADALRKVCQNTDYFMARYGGDEFIVIADLKQVETIDELCQRIHSTLNEFCLQKQLPYNLKVSIGYTKYDTSYETISEFIHMADEQLYKVKRAKKQKNA